MGKKIDMALCGLTVVTVGSLAALNMGLLPRLEAKWDKKIKDSVSLGLDNVLGSAQEWTEKNDPRKMVWEKIPSSKKRAPEVEYYDSSKMPIGNHDSSLYVSSTDSYDF